MLPAIMKGRAVAYTFTKILFPGDTSTEALGINNTDVIVGFHGLNTESAFVLTLPSAFTLVTPMGAAQSRLAGINNVGNTSVGSYIDASDTTHGFLNSGGILTTQDQPGTAFNRLHAINDKGQEVGYSSQEKTGETLQLAYVREANGTYTALDNAAHTLLLPANVNSQATGINNTGDIVGFYQPTATTSRGFLLRNGKLTILQAPDATSTEVRGINNQGQVSGSYTDGKAVDHGFVWSNGNWTTVDPPGAVATTVSGSNDKGHIVGFADLANGNVEGFKVNLPLAQVTDITTNTSWQQALSSYSGPLPFLSSEFIYLTPNNLNISTSESNVFLHSGAGNDALSVTAGQNVLDGGTGFNFLTGGLGPDTFFVDARGAARDIWSTMNKFRSGDSATVFGVTAADFTQPWADGEGAAGFTGLTAHIPLATGALASLTLTNYTTADLVNGRLTVQFGTDPGSGSTYMFVQAN
jgi:Ca2+-binding RTX toxin-like protein